MENEMKILNLTINKDEKNIIADAWEEYYASQGKRLSDSQKNILVEATNSTMPNALFNLKNNIEANTSASNVILEFFRLASNCVRINREAEIKFNELK